MEQQENSRGRIERDLMRSGYQAGMYDPIIRYLESEVKSCSKPIKPTGAEWPYLRATRDGEANEALKVLRWLLGRCKKSPDEAQNTED